MVRFSPADPHPRPDPSPGVVSAPLWNSEASKFAGMLTVLDIIHLIQYYYRTASYDYAAADVETFRLESLRDIELSLGVDQPPLMKEHPSSSLYDASRTLMKTHARRLPLLDYDTETGHEVIVSVLTQYRLLKFISINCHKEVQQLHMPLRRLKIGTYVSPASELTEGQSPYHPIATAYLSTPVFDVVHMFSERSISAVPIIDDQGVVVNLYETVDVIEEERRGGKKGRLLGIITLSDVLRYIIGKVDDDDHSELKSSQSEPSMKKPPRS
ncbi:hypothetical protein NLJ89_g9814 [Agrocybe chaxingu]|uniref:CBS domain-containing protein n=1 Tax=Agrocybe chaxingu TaxID=84603 RepID=A0A9W8JRZ5_9AGAR|nr:hypothetical protein NLJ89_g9814 [Agrocybe chaxingu]